MENTERDSITSEKTDSISSKTVAYNFDTYITYIRYNNLLKNLIHTSDTFDLLRNRQVAPE